MRLRIHPKSRSLAPEAPQSIMCKLSVIIPIYNTSAALPRCIDSILCQGFSDFELLLVDDGSTDGSGALCDQYATKDSRIRVFHKPWGGTSSARNVGLDHATGEWVTFVDSDDYIEEGYFALPYDTAIGLYVRRWSYANGQSAEHIAPQTVLQPRYWDFLKEVMHCFAFRTGCSFFYQRIMIEKGGIRFDERFHLGEDTLFAIDYFKCIDTLQTMAGPAYRYDRFEHWEEKHLLSWDEAQSYLSTFMDKYETLPVEAPALMTQMFGLIHTLVAKHEKCFGAKWLHSEPVKRMIRSQIAHRRYLPAIRNIAKTMLPRKTANG